MAMIETYGLTKRYGNFMAVNEVSIRVRAGKIYGFLGLNGVGTFPMHDFDDDPTNRQPDQQQADLVKHRLIQRRNGQEPNAGR